MVSRQKALSKVFGDPQARILKRLEKKVVAINALADKYKALKKAD
jgi:preprotein translocase subunit SecA